MVPNKFLLFDTWREYIINPSQQGGLIAFTSNSTNSVQPNAALIANYFECSDFNIILDFGITLVFINLKAIKLITSNLDVQKSTKYFNLVFILTFNYLIIEAFKSSSILA